MTQGSAFVNVPSEAYISGGGGGGGGKASDQRQRDVSGGGGSGGVGGVTSGGGGGRGGGVGGGSVGGEHDARARLSDDVSARMAAAGGGMDAAAAAAAGSHGEGAEKKEQTEWLREGKQKLSRTAGIPGDGSGGELRDAALLVVAYNRPDYLRKTLDSLATVSSLQDVSVYVSQDGNDVGVSGVAAAAESRGLGRPKTRGYTHWKRERIPQLGRNQPGHAWLAQHYKWAIDRIFLERRHSHLIIAEDDMLFSPDFVAYFKQTAVLLERDPSLWCVSTWNDNGMAKLARDPRRLFRTSYFPGLGWMMRRELWEEIGPRWPKEHWDHWMRLNTTSRGRECVIPEVNRNYNIGEVGANMKRDVYAKYLKHMSLNHVNVKDLGDLSYVTRDAYRRWIAGLFENSVTWQWHSEPLLSWAARHAAVARGGGGAGEGGGGGGERNDPRPILALYRSENYANLAKHLNIWPYPRGHHRFATVIYVEGYTVVLADERYCPYLPEGVKLRPSRGLQPVAATRAQNCDAACADRGLRCHSPDFWFLNSCETLAEYFPCEGGCALVLGDDIPNYVMGEEMDTYQKCLVNERQSTCAASHHGTARLCACL